MEVTTIQKYIHATPRKLRLVADMVRKMTPNHALNILKATPKMAALDMEKALGTVLANAKQQGLDAAKLTFAKIEVNESMKMRRFRAGTRGRVKPFKRRMSHIKIILTDDLRDKSRQSSVVRLKTEQPENKKVERKKGEKSDS
ncbi:50S ribosomal protein L22 [Candidatus Daviesbacteria bacterium]|nr:50S ribosomal protein L22 [Candidatus Daviesbacteria bacterium]